MSRVLVIDGNNLVHRVYWISNKTSDNDGLLHVSMFLKCVRSYHKMYTPSKIICVWDKREENVQNERVETLPEYKGTRNVEYSKQVHSNNCYIEEILESMGIQNIFPQKLEADDLIASIKDIHNNEEIVIITVDKDLCQLIDNRTVVFDPIRKQEINNNNFQEILKCDIKDFLTYKCFEGDRSDNIPGIKGFGKKKIQKYLNGEICLTEEQITQYEKNKSLMELSSDNIDRSFCEEAVKKEVSPNWKKFISLCEELNFESILKNKEQWYSDFFQKRRLLDILSKIV